MKRSSNTKSGRSNLRRSIVVVVLLAGCGPASIDTTYGRRRGAKGASSVNGTSVLAEMFEQSGFRVRSVSRLLPAIDSADVLVWFPDDFGVPPERAVNFIENWLMQKQGRTMIYVGRDYDASVSYWDRMLAAALPESRLEIRRRLAKTKSEHHFRRLARPDKADCPWFTIEEVDSPRHDVMVRGVWTEELDTRQMEAELATAFKFPEPSEALKAGTVDPSEIVATPLLLTEDHVLLAELKRPTWQENRIFVVHNGSWLLNLPLVQHEHRKLACRLIDECGESGRAVFLETSEGGPRVIDQVENAHHAWKAFTVWPLNCILLHVTVLGILFCFTAFPIFGRAKKYKESLPTDFGKHIDALGKLYSDTHDAAYARDRLVYYRDKTRSEPARLSSRERLAGETSKSSISKEDIESNPIVAMTDD